MEKIIKIYKNINNENVLTITINDDTMFIIGKVDQKDQDELKKTFIQSISNLLDANPMIINLEHCMFMNSSGFKCLLDMSMIASSYNTKIIIKANKNITWQLSSLKILPFMNNNLEIQWTE